MRRVSFFFSISGGCDRFHSGLAVKPSVILTKHETTIPGITPLCKSSPQPVVQLASEVSRTDTDLLSKLPGIGLAEELTRGNSTNSKGSPRLHVILSPVVFLYKRTTALSWNRLANVGKIESN